MENKRWIRVVWFILAVCFLSGCGAGVKYITVIDLSKKDLPKGLEKRVSLYWSYRAESNLNNSWKLEAPHIRYKLPLQEYQQYFRSFKKIVKIDIVRYQQIDDLTILDAKFFKDDKKDYYQNDYWVNLDGEWYHTLKDKLRGID